jgi:hypothetical protein
MTAGIAKNIKHMKHSGYVNLVGVLKKPKHIGLIRLWHTAFL